MTTTALSGTTAPTPASNSVSASASGLQALGQNAFLQLLTTELQYQDPLQPMDNTEFVAQLAQFSQLEQLTNLNQSMTTLGNSLSTLSGNQAVNLIGRTVTAQGNGIQLSGGTTAPLTYSLGGNAASVTLSITDSAGNPVRTLQFGPQNAGTVTAQWDGLNSSGQPAAPGSYQFTVSALDATGQAVSTSTFTQGAVTGIAYNSGTPSLMINGAAIPVSGVLQVN